MCQQFDLSVGTSKYYNQVIFNTCPVKVLSTDKFSNHIILTFFFQMMLIQVSLFDLLLFYRLHILLLLYL